MDSFTSFLQSLRLGMGRGYERPSNQARLDPETLSASVDLDDIISEYDDPGGRSRFASSHEGPTSQSYFSLPGSGPIDEETTSFYSALHDGFSLDEFELRNKYGREFFWSNNNSNSERDTMLQPSDFQITWSDLNYSIRPRHTLADLADDCRSKLIDSISSVSSILKYCKTSASYDVNGCSPKEAAKPGGRSETISILQSVNGSFKSGELTAVMGPSGAGKTSLLNILSRRREDGFTGQVHVNEANHRIRINAIPQHDHLPECFTVRENLLFASRLKNTSPNQNHEKNVTRVSNLLGLDECLDTRSRNISGGQQKRLAIAQELLSRPDILILDEPTSGLDSLTCLKTLSVLKDLVKASSRKMIEPIAVVLTIHQPQQEAFSLFDKVYVMANGGIVIYDGPPTNCADFVEKYSRLKMPSDDYNPATFLIEIASGEYGQEPIEALAQQVRLEYRKERDRPTGAAVGRTNHGNDNRVTESCDSIERSSSLRSQGKTIKPSHRSGLYLDPQLAKSSSIDSGKFFAKTRILAERCWKAMWRDKRFMSGKVLLYLLLPFAMAFMLGTDPGHSNACPKYHSEYSLIGVMRGDEFTSGQVQEEFLLAVENSGGLFMLIYSCISANIAIMTLTFALDMQSCLKEYYNGWYSMNSYIFARLLSNIPINLTLPTMTIAISYVVTGQNTGGNMPDVYRIGITSLAVVLGSMVGEIVGMIFGAIYIGHITTALFASQGATLPFVLLSGFVARTKNMSKFVQVLSMTSLYKHCLEVAYIARYGWNICGCDQTRLQIKKPQLTGVSDNLRNFVRFYMNSQDSAKESATETLRSNSTTLAPATNEEADIFQMIAKQLSLYNTYGIEVKSCEQITPYLMYDFGLTERDLSASFTALVTLLLSLLIILLLVVRLVVNYRTSL